MSLKHDAMNMLYMLFMVFTITNTKVAVVVGLKLGVQWSENPPTYRQNLWDILRYHHHHYYIWNFRVRRQPSLHGAQIVFKIYSVFVLSCFLTIYFNDHITNNKWHNMFSAALIAQGRPFSFITFFFKPPDALSANPTILSVSSALWGPGQGSPLGW